MRASFFSATLAVIAGVSALPAPQELPDTKILPALPLDIFADAPKFVAPLPLEVAKEKFENHTEEAPKFGTRDVLESRQNGRCSNVRVRPEWHSTSDADKQAFVDGIRCLMNRPSNGQFGQSRSRYEDLVALHQTLTPNVHGNAKFLLWHRYYLWTFEDMMRNECGYSRAIPWFDETRYAGRFAQSSIFSGRWFGAIALGGRCVTDGQFRNLAINVGPGSGNQPHCLARAGDGSRTAQCNQAYVDQCNAFGDFAGMADCAESGPHAWGHNGIGAVMQDTYASPADPVFWLHHAFVDRNFRIWQNANEGVRVNSISGSDSAGRPLTLDTGVSVNGFRPNVQIRNILDTQGQTLCYKYNY